MAVATVASLGTLVILVQSLRVDLRSIHHSSVASHTSHASLSDEGWVVSQSVVPAVNLDQS